MMMWIDIASIVFACVTMNHLGLVKAVEETLKKEIPVINCPKCSTFWFTLIYSYHFLGITKMIYVFAISFLASYMAIWLELSEGFIDSLYLKCYEKIYPDATDDTASADDEQSDTDSTVPELQ